MFEAAFAIALVLTAPTRSLDGTLVRIDNGNPSQIVIRAEGQFQTFALTKRVVVDRESSFANDAAARTARIQLADLTPGEYVRLQIDAQGQVTKARAVATLERAKVRSANGSSVVLEDGTTLTIGSVLRFVNERGKPSPTATVRSGESVLLFRHPQTRNIYRFSAEPRIRLRKRADAS
jgi:hypothetical protein